jgi:hypothetical protein
VSAEHSTAFIIEPILISQYILEKYFMTVRPKIKKLLSEAVACFGVFISKSYRYYFI